MSSGVLPNLFDMKVCHQPKKVENHCSCWYVWDGGKKIEKWSHIWLIEKLSDINKYKKFSEWQMLWQFGSSSSADSRTLLISVYSKEHESVSTNSTIIRKL